MNGPHELAEKITNMTRTELVQFIGLTVGECNLLARKLKIVIKALEEHGCFCQEADDCNVEKHYVCTGCDIEKQWANL